MKLYRVNYEEYLHYEEFIEASSPEEAERVFKNSIHTLEPTEGEVYTFDVEEEGGNDVGHSITQKAVRPANKLA